MSKKFTPPVSAKTAKKRAQKLVAQMTREEKISLIGGDRIFFTNAIPRLGIPAIMMTDATNGINLREKFQHYVYEKVIPKSTSFPCGLTLAATWNRDLSYRYAEAIGEECKAGGISVLLGPGMNIYRISQCGRNFEYFGEDPILAAAMVKNYVLGMQSTGTIATLKHFVANNSDFFRRRSNSIVDDRSLHEIYMPAFEAGIAAGAMAVMTSYNLLNGEWCSQSDFVINNLLRRQLGFDWLVMTDWWAVYDGRKTLKSGQDLEMPDRLVALKNCAELIDQDSALETDLDRMVTSILKTLIAMKSFDRVQDPSLLNRFAAHEAIALQTAREGTVLLRNHQAILPLAGAGKKILLTGDYAEKIAAGGGASLVEGYNQTTLAQALTKVYGEALKVAAHPSDQEIAAADVVILSIGTFDSEGWDHPFDLPPDQEAAILRIAALNNQVVAVINSGSGINMSRWHDKMAAILYAWYGGQNGATAVAEIISGMVNPSGKLPISIERDFQDSPGYGYLPAGEQLYSGWNEEAEKNHAVFDVKYNEGVFVGYRWYESRNIAPLYPFGFGLSYTSFAYSKLKVQVGRQIKVTCQITNTGKRTGSEIVQVYIQDVEASVPRPIKELKAFQRITLAAGKTGSVSLRLSRQDFQFWNPETRAWTLEPGQFRILVGGSSADIRMQAEIRL